MYAYCVYPAMSKSPNLRPNCLKIAETSAIIIVFNGVLFEIRVYTVTISLILSLYMNQVPEKLYQVHA